MATAPGGGVGRSGRERTRFSGAAREAWRLSAGRLDRRDPALRRRLSVGILAVLLVGTGVVASAGLGSATAEQTALTGQPVPDVPVGPSGVDGPTGVVPSSGTMARPVPDGYLPAVLAAGRSCPGLTPARVAAQLMASSGFDPNLFVAPARQGIAQFSPQVWARYVRSANTTSPWDPGVAIPAVGRTMCVLMGELGGLGMDPYRLALAAFRAGPETVVRSGGLPDDLDVRGYVDLTMGYLDHYQQDPRLGGEVPPSASPAGGKPTGARPSAGAGTPGAGRPEAGKPGAGSPSTAKPSGAATPARSPQARSSAGAAKRNWQTRVVRATSTLQLGQSWSTDRLKLVLANDGNVILHDQGKAVWQTGTKGRGGHHLVFQADGNLVLYTGSNATVWTSNTPGNDGAILVLQADGNVTISNGGRGLWHTGTMKG
ncbi:hypothetical protein ACQPYA_13330 [Micromonospora sp. CA-263727]|uniref:hypothetical protein n=1 Tax=Micromonospora sp. CA-263727 TaxID=3239967 RepID=UPI003D9043A5